MPVDKSFSSRKLSAILFADVVGYTALMQKDEKAASRQLHRFQDEMTNQVEEHNGTIVNFYGDGALCTFDNPLEAMRCAIRLQSDFQSENKVPVRIGIHSGTVVTEGDKVFGDSVNLASRIESMGIPGAILVSKKVRDELKNQPDLLMPSLGTFEFKNVEEPMEIFALANEGFAVPKKEEMGGKLKAAASSKSKNIIPIAAFFLALSGFCTWYFLNQSNATDQKFSEVNTVAIFPFDIKGSSDIQYLGEGIVDLLSTKLDGIPGVNPIDPNRIFNELDPDENLNRDLEEAADISENLGASNFVIGSIVELNDELQIAATQYELDGNIKARKSVSGSKEKLVVLIDDLTKSLLLSDSNEGGTEVKNLAVISSGSLPALKAFLKGEQAFRGGRHTEAFQHYSDATNEDSTYAMAWLRLRAASTWSPELNAPGALNNAEKYVDKLPAKWKGLIDAIRMYNSTVPQTESFYQKLIDEYGETREFTNGMAEYLFHFNPIHGRSSTEAKPWLLRTKELDPNNQEVNIHLADIALVEGDSVLAQQLLNESDISVESWGKYKTISMYFKGDTTQAEIEKVLDHDGFKDWYVHIGMAAPDDASHYLEFLAHFSKNLRTEEGQDLWLRSHGLLYGKEEDAFEASKAFLIANSDESWAPMVGMRRKVLPAVMITGNGYNPLASHYEEFLNALKEETQPWAYYASAKYALVLGREEDAKGYKKKLKQSITNNGPLDMAKYLDFSLEAYEAKSRGEIDLCLALIDSAFQYTPGYWPSQTACMDKIFMLAEIYESRQEYDKSISYYENIPVVDAFTYSKGFATYKLGQLYEKTGQVNKALTKCNLLIKDYAECDKKYKPWVREATERRDRLMAQLL